MTETTPICKNCTHYMKIKDADLCARPLSSKTSLVTGEALQRIIHLFCEYERRSISRLERLFGCDDCGEIGRHFLAKNKNENP